MKNLLFVVAMLAAPASAQQKGQLGLGILLGDPTSGTAKYFLDDKNAFDFGIGWSADVVLHADYVWHGWELIPDPSRGKLAAYAAIGPRFETQRDFDFGIRTMLGLSYFPHLKRRVVEFFVELGPCFRLEPTPARVRVDGGFGLRYYFSRKKE